MSHWVGAPQAELRFHMMQPADERGVHVREFLRVADVLTVQLEARQPAPNLAKTCANLRKTSPMPPG